MEARKKDHIDLTFKSQTGLLERDERFHYEPMLSAHPHSGLKPFNFLGKEQSTPIWVSSITGGTRLAGKINRNLAKACNEFGMGMGLGSCRMILEDDSCFNDFNMRPIIGDSPLWANLGISQIEELIENDEVPLALELVKRLEADGLIIHVNPLQEWFQPEGDRVKQAPIDTLKKFLDSFHYPVIVKEVGQGMGPESLRQLLQLPLQAIEFGAYGGANFTQIELHRNENMQPSLFDPLTHIGEDALSMLEYVNEIIALEDSVCNELIISGGVKDFLDGYYLIQKSQLPAIYGMASTFLKYAQGDYEQLREYIETQVQGLKMAYAYLTVRQ